MSIWVLYIGFGSLAFASLAIVVLELLGQYRRYSGTRIVTCPATARPEAMIVDPWKAALPVVFGRAPVLQITDCSRWAEHCDCEGRCRDQIALSPDETLLRSILAERFASQTCAGCFRRFSAFDYGVPALLSPDRVLVDVMDIPADRIEEFISTHAPVCDDCYRELAAGWSGQKAFFASRRIGML